MKLTNKTICILTLTAMAILVMPAIVTADDSPVKFEAPAALDVPERMEVKSDADWKAKVNNKNAEIIEVLNILNPVAAFLIAAFEQFDTELSEVTHEEWEDTQAQLTKALALYDESKKAMTEEKFSKKLFLNLEETWQILVKVGVAGVRTKSMVDSDLARMKQDN